MEDPESATGWAAAAALICGPASHHVEMALPLAEAGVHLFIEKPISDRLDPADELVALCRAKRLVLMVGYNLRFYEPLRRVREARIRDGSRRLTSLESFYGVTALESPEPDERGAENG